MGRVPCDVGPRTRSGPEGSSLKRVPAGASGSSPTGARTAGGTASVGLEGGCTVHFRLVVPVGACTRRPVGACTDRGSVHAPIPNSSSRRARSGCSRSGGSPPGRRPCAASRWCRAGTRCRPPRWPPSGRCRAAIGATMMFAGLVWRYERQQRHRRRVGHADRHAARRDRVALGQRDEVRLRCAAGRSSAWSAGVLPSEGLVEAGHVPGDRGDDRDGDQRPPPPATAAAAGARRRASASRTGRRRRRPRRIAAIRKT